MTLPDPPDLARPRRRLVYTALVVAAFVGVVTGFRDAGGLARSLGDTDDAMRMVLARSLLHGQGWWDQHVTRLQPPLGVTMHWSRLLDGGIAAMERMFLLVASPGQADWLTRLLWPLLWVAPGALAVLVLSDTLSERRGDVRPVGAALICAALLAASFVLYIQFHPGRVDHHDVQMVMCLCALAGACERRRPVAGALVCGVATGLGLAIGLEALLFDAAIGAVLALRFAFDVGRRTPTAVYGLALAGSVALAYLVQTPPWRWTLSACDALAFNSAAAAAAAGLMLAALAALASRAPLLARVGLLAGAGGGAAALYLGLDPRCLKGPFADVDPAIKTFWLAHVQEMRPWLVVLKTKPQDALSLAAAPAAAVLGLAWLARRPSARRDPALGLCALVLAMTMAAGFAGVRMCGYADWVALPVIAAAGADLAGVLSARFKRDTLILVILGVVSATSETAVQGAVTVSTALAALGRPHAVKPPAAKENDRCFDTRPYQDLVRAGPPGLVLSEIDLGPFILANSQDSALAAPYHRMSWGLVKARAALGADADRGAEAAVRSLGVAYVVECRAHRGHTDRLGLGPNSLQKRLDAGSPPGWLERTDPPSSVLQVFRLRPAAGGR